MDPTVIVAAIGGLSGLGAAIYSARSARRATETTVEAGAYERARQMYEGTVTRMQTEIDRQGRQIGTLQRQVAQLSHQVTHLGGVPAFTPDPDGGPVA